VLVSNAPERKHGAGFFLKGERSQPLHQSDAYNFFIKFLLQGTYYKSLIIDQPKSTHGSATQKYNSK
jgi:hypothetical protein